MSGYNHILVGLDLSTESQQVIDRVKYLFANTDTKVSLCHVLEPLAFTYGGDIPVDLSDVQSQLQQQATERIALLGEQLDINSDDQHIILGHPAQEMHRMASEQDIDLIVVGSHGRQVWR
jgi:universal stress protein A